MYPFKLRLPTLITAVVALALLTVAIDWSTPTGVALADHGIHTPGKPTAASSAGVMMVSWGSTTGATSGYQYRYSTNSLCLLVGSDCDFEGPGKDWTDHGSGANSNEVTFPGEGDTPPALEYGHTYFFQVRGRAGDARGAASDSSNGVFHAAPSPAKLANVVATAGNAKVTLSWDDPPAGDNVLNYDYRQNDGGEFPVTWTNFTEVTSSEGKTSYTVSGLTNSTTYSFQVRARNTVGEGPDSDTVSATPSGPPAAPADLRATPQNGSVRLHWNDPNDDNIDKYQWSHPSPREVKWYRVRRAKGSDASLGEWQQIPGTGATMTHTIEGLKNGTTYSFQVQAVGAGDNNLTDPSNTATATPRVPRPPTGGGGPSGPQRDSVTAHNSDETIDVTIEKPASVMLDVAVVDQACNTAAPGGSVHLCVQASASGSGVVDSLKANSATMTIVISQDRWIQMEGAYNADPRRFFLSKRSSPVEAWANIAWCLDDPAVECYRVVETEQAGATVYVRNIVSFSQYAIRTVVVGGGAGARCVGINCRAVIIGGGGGTGRGPQHRLPATTRTPAPTPRPTVAPTVRPTVVPPTVTPTAVPPTSVPPTRVPPTALPPTPTEAPTPPVQVEAPTPPPPTPVDAPTLEPTEVTAALPPTAVAPAPTPIPLLVGEPEGNLPPWLLIVIIAAVLAVGGMGFLAFRLLRAQ